MFAVNEDKSIFCTRGDCGVIVVSMERDGETYLFRPDDVVRFQAYHKKGCHKVVIQKEIVAGIESEEVAIYLSAAETKIGEIISKPVDYWYEIELNPYTNPETIIGYDEDGAKVFRLFPEGADANIEPPADIPVDEVCDSVAEALARAKASGAFDGEDGYTPVKDMDYFDGEDGYTPKKGVDYYTDAERAAMVQDVLAAIPIYNGETEDVI
jgi:hypothetical protein